MIVREDFKCNYSVMLYFFDKTVLLYKYTNIECSIFSVLYNYLVVS